MAEANRLNRTEPKGSPFAALTRREQQERWVVFQSQRLPLVHTEKPPAAGEKGDAPAATTAPPTETRANDAAPQEDTPAAPVSHGAREAAASSANRLRDPRGNAAPNVARSGRSPSGVVPLRGMAGVFVAQPQSAAQYRRGYPAAIAPSADPQFFAPQHRQYDQVLSRMKAASRNAASFQDMV